MNPASRIFMRAWTAMGSRWLPFADAATPDLPLARLLRLSLFQVAVGMALVMLVGTLNRVMIVELGVPASLVGIMISLPIVFAPLRALIGFRSDTHRSALGWKRVPFIFRGSMVQFGGFAVMPFALLVLSGAGDSATLPSWVGLASAALAFLLVGAGMHTIQTVGLALATDLAPRESRPNVVGLMYVMLLAGMMGSALLFGTLLENFSHGRLIQVVQAAAVVTLVLTTISVWKQEARRRSSATAEREPTFGEAWALYAGSDRAVWRLFVVGVGTMAFSMSDVLLEPYGGQVLGMSVADTTKLTATLAGGGLIGFAWASRVLRGGFDPWRMAAYGASCGVPAFAAIIASAPLGSPALFVAGTLFVGFGAGLFGHGTLTATMNLAPRQQTGLALGAWGAVQATGAGAAIALGSIIRDVCTSLFGSTPDGGVLAYQVVYGLEIAMLAATCITMLPLMKTFRSAVGRA